MDTKYKLNIGSSEPDVGRGYLQRASLSQGSNFGWYTSTNWPYAHTVLLHNGILMLSSFTSNLVTYECDPPFTPGHAYNTSATLAAIGEMLLA